MAAKTPSPWAHAADPLLLHPRDMPAAESVHPASRAPSAPILTVVRFSGIVWQARWTVRHDAACGELAPLWCVALHFGMR